MVAVRAADLVTLAEGGLWRGRGGDGEDPDQ